MLTKLCIWNAPADISTGQQFIGVLCDGAVNEFSGFAVLAGRVTLHGRAAEVLEIRAGRRFHDATDGIALGLDLMREKTLLKVVLQKGEKGLSEG